jgi:hypothetical protein
MTPTQRSLKLLRAEGFTVAIVEKWNPYARVRQDLFGFADIIAVHPGRRKILLVQTTTASNKAARKKKAEGLAAMRAWTEAGGEVELHGWKKKAGRWQCSRGTIEAADAFPAVLAAAAAAAELPASRRKRSNAASVNNQPSPKSE